MTVPDRLPRPAPARVLGCGAFLKNRACLLDGDRLHWSPPHGDLATPAACAALDASLEALLAASGGRIDAVAHDLHPDFDSTRRALALAARLGVPAVAVQHHHAHVGVVQARQGSTAPVIGLALDGVGLGSDGSAWGGELLLVAGARWRRLGHLTPLALPGGDIAAREPWRMAAAALHALGQADAIVPRLAPRVGLRLAAGVRTMLDRGLNCPPTTAAGRWFDALAGLRGLSLRQSAEAEAAIALERAAADGVAARGRPAESGDGLDLRGLVARCIADADDGAAAARFHAGLARGLADAAAGAARAAAVDAVALAGGCFANRILSAWLAEHLRDAGLAVQTPGALGPGDAGLALGQAWIAAWTLAEGRASAAPAEETAACA